LAEGDGKKRLRVFFSGLVQGVGFRYTAFRVASNFRVTGFVRNLRDGRVELVAEGEASEVKAFIAEVRKRMANYIEEVEEHEEPYSGEFRRFEIAF